MGRRASGKVACGPRAGSYCIINVARELDLRYSQGLVGDRLAERRTALVTALEWSWC